jgi:hypothetical protein
VDTAEGAVRWIFSSPAPRDSVLAQSGLEGWACLLGVLGYTGVALAFLYRRFERLAV